MELFNDRCSYRSIEVSLDCSICGNAVDNDP